MPGSLISRIYTFSTKATPPGWRASAELRCQKLFWRRRRFFVLLNRRIKDSVEELFEMQREALLQTVNVLRFLL
jgi:hypothetical protein